MDKDYLKIEFKQVEDALRGLRYFLSHVNTSNIGLNLTSETSKDYRTLKVCLDNAYDNVFSAISALDSLKNKMF